MGHKRMKFLMIPKPNSIHSVHRKRSTCFGENSNAQSNFFGKYTREEREILSRSIPACRNLVNSVFANVFHSYHLKMLSIHKSQMNVIFVPLHKNIIVIYF